MDYAKSGISEHKQHRCFYLESLPALITWVSSTNCHKSEEKKFLPLASLIFKESYQFVSN